MTTAEKIHIKQTFKHYLLNKGYAPYIHKKSLNATREAVRCKVLGLHVAIKDFSVIKRCYEFPQGVIVTLYKKDFDKQEITNGLFNLDKNGI